MIFGMGPFEVHNYSHAPTAKFWSINHQHLPSSEENKSFYKHENFEELLQPELGAHTVK